MSEQLTVKTLFEDMTWRLSLKWWAGQQGADRSFTENSSTSDTSALVGHFNQIHSNQAQILGKTELTYLTKLRMISRQDAYQQLFDSDTVLIIIAEGQQPPEEFSKLAKEHRIAILLSTATSNQIINHLRYYFTHTLADKTTLHGVFLEVLSIGVLLSGDSGVGKSELALELITRGHRLIADDAPEFARIAPDIINGTCPPMLQDFLEVRGLGILNIRAMYGDSVIKNGKYLRLIIELKHPQNHAELNEDRLNTKQRTRNVLGLEVPVFSLPVAPGRNLAVLVEAAVRNHLLRLNGYRAGDDLIARQQKLVSENH